MVVEWGLLRRKRKVQRQGMVGIYETTTSIAVVYAIPNGAQVTVKAHVFQTVPDEASKQTILNQFVIDNELQGLPCSYVLNTGEYTLNLVDVPAVAKGEVSLALRWIIKDLIHFPIEEAEIETFDLPFPRARDNAKMVYAVAMRNILIPKIESVIEQSGLELKYIDIPELILKNIVNRHPQQLKGGVFLQLNEMGGRLILCRNEQVCITRSFEIKLNNLGKDPEADNRALESLALEVQRSFDYINSIFRQSVPNVIIVAPTAIDKNILEASLKSTLGSEVYFLKLSEHFIFEPPIKEEDEANILLAAGAILREEEAPQKNEEKKEGKAK